MGPALKAGLEGNDGLGSVKDPASACAWERGAGWSSPCSHCTSGASSLWTCQKLGDPGVETSLVLN